MEYYTYSWGLLLFAVTGFNIFRKGADLKIPTGVTTAHPDGKSYNNPLNLRGTGDWEGEDSPTYGFSNFKHPAYGYRAGYRQLLTYFQRDGLHNIYDLIDKFAPASDGNDVPGYVNFVTKNLGYDGNYNFTIEEFKLSLPNIIRRMTEKEQGWKLSDSLDTLQDYWIITAANMAMPDMNFSEA